VSISGAAILGGKPEGMFFKDIASLFPREPGPRFSGSRAIEDHHGR
jgi:hypothetical protein